MRPVLRQWPIFLVWIVLVGWSSLLQNPFYRWFVIFLHAYVVACLAMNKATKCVCYALTFMLFLIETTLEACYGLAISPSTLLLLVETNPKETAEFFDTIVRKPAFWSVILLFFLFAGMACWAESVRNRGAQWLSRPKTYRVLQGVTAVFLLVGLLCSECYVRLFQCKTMDEVSRWNLQMRHPSDAATRVVIAFFDTHLAARETEKAINCTMGVRQSDAVTDDSLNVVFVIGESFIRSHSPLYGYTLNTTPFMLSEKRQGRLFVFSDVVSPYNITTMAVRNIISCNAMSDGKHWSDAPPLTAVFRSNGFYVSMYDNQRLFSFASTQTYALNYYLYNPAIIGKCYDETNDRTFDWDGDLVDYYRHRSRPAATHRLAIFHLMGQHFKCNLRYPTEDSRFSRFTADSILRDEPWMTERKKEEIAQYDNATLYNDYVIQKIVQIYGHENTVLVYLSDHGEEIYDYRDSSGRVLGDDLGCYLDYQFGVPFIVWCSDRYLELHPEMAEHLRNAEDSPSMTDNTCQLLFHLAGLYGAPYYRVEHDVLTEEYRCGQRILNDCWDYDKVKKH